MIGFYTLNIYGPWDLVSVHFFAAKSIKESSYIRQMWGMFNPFGFTRYWKIQWICSIMKLFRIWRPLRHVDSHSMTVNIISFLNVGHSKFNRTIVLTYLVFKIKHMKKLKSRLKTKKEVVYLRPYGLFRQPLILF